MWASWGQDKKKGGKNHEESQRYQEQPLKHWWDRTFALHNVCMREVTNFEHCQILLKTVCRDSQNPLDLQWCSNWKCYLTSVKKKDLFVHLFWILFLQHVLKWTFCLHNWGEKKAGWLHCVNTLILSVFLIIYSYGEEEKWKKEWIVCEVQLKAFIWSQLFNNIMFSATVMKGWDLSNIIWND